MIDPLSIASIIGLGFAGAKTLANLIPTKAEVSQRKRIKELTKLEEQGRLGLTDQQRADLTSLGLEPLQAKERELRARAGETIGLEQIGAGGTILQQQSTEDAIRQATKDVGIAVQQADQVQAQQQKQELEGLKQQELALQTQTKQDILQGAEDIIIGGINVAAQTQRAKQEGLLLGNEKALRNSMVAFAEKGELILPNGQYNPMVLDTMRALGFNDEQTRLMLDTYSPEEVMAWFQQERFRMPSNYTFMGQPVGPSYGPTMTRPTGGR